MLGLVMMSGTAAAAAGEERQAKYAKVQGLRGRLPFMTQTALAAVLKIARDEPEALPAACSRSTVARARDATAMIQTPYGPLHQNITLMSKPDEDSAEEELQIEVQHPMAMLSHCCSTSEALSGLVQRTAAADPVSPEAPWTMVLYLDEVLPGQALAYTHERKMWAVYWTFLNIASAALSAEEHSNTYVY